MKEFFEKFYIFSKVVVTLIPIVLLGWLIQKDLVMSGHLEFVYDFSKDSPVITNLFPANRMSDVYQIKDTNSYFQIINEEPVYFETRLPQKFDTAEVEIIYQNQNQPLIQVGLNSLGESEWNYNFKALENKILNNLDWPKVEDQRGTIWQRQKKFLSWDQFFDQINNINNISAYNFNLERSFSMPSYQPTGQITSINKTIRGAHSFYTYIKNETLNFTFLNQDINRKDGPDYLSVKVYNSAGDKIYEKTQEDDGYISKLDPASDPRELNVSLNGLPEGVYKIELDCEDEIFFRSVKTTQQYITFINRVYLADNLEYADGLVGLNYGSTSLYSTMPRLGFETSHPKGLQNVSVNNNQTVEIKETHKNYYLTPDELPAIIYSPLNDLKIFGRGLISFSKQMYFNPEIYNLRDYYASEGTDYLVSEYKIPEEVNSWKINRVKFDLTNASIANRKLRFAISIPELNGSTDQIPIKQIKVSFDKEPMTYKEAFKKIIKYIFDRL